MSEENANAEEAAPDFDRIDAAAAQLEQSADIIPITGENSVNENTAEISASTSELLKPILGVGFQFLAPNWKVSEPEINQLSDAYGAVIDKYFPDGGAFDQYGTEIAAVMLTAMIIMPRKDIPRTDAIAKEKAETEKTEKHTEVKMEVSANG